MSVSCYEFLNYHFFSETRTLLNIQTNQETYLEPKVADLLLYFLQNPQRVISKDELIKDVWQDSVITDNSISWAISQLRKALDDHPKAPTFIKTYPKKGYQFLPAPNIVKSNVVMNNVSIKYVDKNTKPTSSQSMIAKQRPRFINTNYLILTIFVISLLSLFYFQSQVDSLTKLENIQNITNLDGAEEDPRLSPEGNLLLFRHKANTSDSTFQLYIADLNAQNAVHRLTHDKANYVNAIWGDNIEKIFAVKVEKNNNDFRCTINSYDLQSLQALVTLHKTLHQCDGMSATSLAYHQATNTLYFTDKIDDNKYAVYKLNLTSNKIKQLTTPEKEGLGDNFISLDLAQEKLLILRDSFWSNTEFVSLNLQTNQLESLLSIQSRYYKAYFSPNSEQIWLNSGNDVLVSYDPKKEQSTPLLTNTFGWNYNLSPESNTDAFLVFQILIMAT
ncbi:winged helix-turn-helix domain-containing protein [Psychrosphaera algicola]|uniref:Winged helix-turn-helix domain-containing protein n=1 Tax=Psychrosphaera algicola TaxID=3023714 RepID=A0ABT5FIN1_9GAMM|nr:winged helix-turn-helix domain-containing protein [Psychrosphaera sp. G1-22]MDC2891041.1 winged helix-turn-helix domain-containing protein [Psychrosphaera sp. G1-22]